MRGVFIKFLNIKNPVLKNKIHYLTSDFKYRNKERKNHNGMDFVSKNSTLDYIISIDDGIVKNTGYDKSAGYYVNILHSNGYMSKYFHLQKKSICVNKNQTIKKGDTLGYMGSSGNSTGGHLHFSVVTKNGITDDPSPYLFGFLDFNDAYYENFVKDIQKILHAKVDGIAGPETLEKTITISSSINNRHELVKILQLYLCKLGYSEIGSPDGIAGKKFTKAIKHFQLDNLLYSDGIITKNNNTWKRLLKLS